MERKTIVIYLLLVLCLPQLILNLAMTMSRSDDERSDYLTEETKDPVVNDSQRSVYISDQGTIREMPLEEYIVGVVLAEMPADFEVEALKAQSVACRTFTLKKVMSSKHSDAYVCTDPSCCQAFTAPDTYTGAISNLEKVRSAVSETKGEVITYQGNLIDATYFSCSGGQTETAAAVWGTDVPYLQSVASPGEEISANFVSTECFDHTTFKEKLDLPQNMALTEQVLAVTYTDGGSVASLRVGSFEYSGVQVRTLLNLRSAAFSVSFEDDSVIITTKGYGHRVGMSQYGAEAMAIDGAAYDDILRHYYTGTELLILSEEHMDTIFDKAEKF